MSLHERLEAEIQRRYRITRGTARFRPEWHDGAYDETSGERYLVGAWEEGDIVYDEIAKGLASPEVAAHIALHDPADALRRYAGYRMLLSIAGVMEEQAKLKQQSADRFGDPKDNPDMTGPDRIAWLLQSDMALTYAEHARQITATVAQALGIEADE